MVDSGYRSLPSLTSEERTVRSVLLEEVCEVRDAPSDSLLFPLDRTLPRDPVSSPEKGFRDLRVGRQGRKGGLPAWRRDTAGVVVPLPQESERVPTAVQPY